MVVGYPNQTVFQIYNPQVQNCIVKILSKVTRRHFPSIVRVISIDNLKAHCSLNHGIVLEATTLSNIDEV